MEINVLNIKGQETGRKVTLNESIFGIEREVSMPVQPASSDARRVAAVPVTVISTHLCCAVVVACSVHVPVIIASS